MRGYSNESPGPSVWSSENYNNNITTDRQTYTALCARRGSKHITCIKSSVLSSGPRMGRVWIPSRSWGKEAWQVKGGRKWASFLFSGSSADLEPLPTCSEMFWLDSNSADLVLQKCSISTYFPPAMPRARPSTITRPPGGPRLHLPSLSLSFPGHRQHPNLSSCLHVLWPQKNERPSIHKERSKMDPWAAK